MSFVDARVINQRMDRKDARINAQVRARHEQALRDKEPMMTTAVATEAPLAPVFPKEQIDLIRRTVANGATNDELALFLYDCQRRGVHPLDKLLHFTKRGGRYTPVTSIDFMRSQAAMSGEMAGSDDPEFVNVNDDINSNPKSATVTVYRMTQGQRFAYTATARWAEYCPDNAPMWKRMPHTMLGKCAEALALRKAFPQQLAGLYSADEMDQAGYAVEAPAAAHGGTVPTDARPVETAGFSDAPRSLSSPVEGVAPSPMVGAALPPGAVYITNVESGAGKTKGWLHHSGQPVSAKGLDGIPIYNDQLMALAMGCCQAKTPVRLAFKTPPSGKTYVASIESVKPAPTDDVPPVRDEFAGPVLEKDIPF